MNAVTRVMRDQCIALEAIRLATGPVGSPTADRTVLELAVEAVAKVDDAADRGELGRLWRAWLRGSGQFPSCAGCGQPLRLEADLYTCGTVGCLGNLFGG